MESIPSNQERWLTLRSSEEPLPRGVYCRKRKDGSITWGARWHDAQGREHKKAATPNTKTAALKLYRKMKHLADEGQQPPTPTSTTLGQVLDHYLPQLQAERPTRAGLRDDACRHRYWKAVFSGYPLTQLTRDLLAQWRSLYLERKAPASAQRMLAWLKAVLSRAVLDGYLPANPAAKLKSLRLANSRIRFLTEAEEAALERACPRWLWEMVFFAIETGLRRGEQFQLAWSQVSLSAHILTIPRSKHGETRHLPTWTVDHLLQAWHEQRTGPWVFPSPGRGRKASSGPRDADNLYSRHFRPACLAAGLADLRWHDLRHTFISRLVMAGEDLRTVMELAGHKRIEMTMRYAHLSPGRAHQAMERARDRRRDRDADRNMGGVSNDEA